jgi:glycosyltransferase involved in cell wall biosynthesis
VDTTSFRPGTPADAQSVQEELGVEGPLIVYAGRLVEEKGIEVILKALDLVGADQEWSMLFLGGGPLEQRVQQWVQDRGFSDRVRIKLAKHDEVSRYLRAGALLLAPSQTRPAWKEQFGRMLVEAFASGLPVVASDSGEIPFVVRDAAIVLPEADAAAWAQAITSLLPDSERREALRRRGLDRARDFSAESVAEIFANIFSELAGKEA